MSAEHSMRVLVLADGDVGASVLEWLLRKYPEDVAGVATPQAGQIEHLASSAGVPCTVERDSNRIADFARGLGRIDLGLLSWWPALIRPPLLKIPNEGFLNFHPSFLPYNRGKHYNFWALVEECPFGVSLHFVDEGIDTGPIVAQRPIAYDWSDTGETLYHRARETIVSLFQDTYPRLRTERPIRCTPQPADVGSSHVAKELGPASRIQLDRVYTGRDLLNLLRARTFTGHPACWFEEDGERYEVRVSITKQTADASSEHTSKKKPKPA